MMSILIDETTLALLPEVVIEIAEIIGFDSTFELINRLGGVAFDVPKGVMSSEREALLVSVIGRENTDALIARFGGERLYIPACSDATRYIRNQQFINDIDKEMATGSSKISAIQQYAPIYGISERHAYEILKNQDNSKQIELFNG